MRLSIITINYNNLIGLLKTIKSVKAQTTYDFEWIVIDGDSTDGGKELIEENAQLVSYWVSEPDNGIYQAMNKGIKASHGDYLLFLNSGDTLYDCHVIEQVLPLLKGKDIYVGLINSIGCQNDRKEEQMDYSPEGVLKKLSHSWIPHQATFFRRNVFDEYGLYREDLRIISDWWFYFSSLVMGKATVESIPYIIANYDTTGISATQRTIPGQEFGRVMQDYPCMKRLFQFYGRNVEIVEALKSNRIIFMLFRVYYFFYRLINRK